MKSVFRLQHVLLLLAAFLLLLTVTAAAADSAQGSDPADSESCAVETGLTVYPGSASELPEPLYSAVSDSEDEIHLPDPAQSRPVILIVSIIVIAVVVSVSIFIEKKYRNKF